jgi:putative ABC transport system permease protein
LNVLTQFLIEALVLSLAGGALGIGVGLGIAQGLAHRFGWPMLVQPEVILASVLFSASVGIIFGLYPARKASQLDPIDALRYE